MSISYQSKDDKVLSVALKVQELSVRSDDSIVSVSGGATLVDVGEKIRSVASGGTLCAMHVVPGTGVTAPAVSVVSDTKISCASTALAAGDVLIVRYVVAE
jgi:hypothetical protein